MTSTVLTPDTPRRTSLPWRTSECGTMVAWAEMAEALFTVHRMDGLGYSARIIDKDRGRRSERIDGWPSVADATLWLERQAHILRVTRFTIDMPPDKRIEHARQRRVDRVPAANGWLLPYPAEA